MQPQHTPAISNSDAATAAFLSARSRLFGIAYRMLVGADRMLNVGYMRAQVAQEDGIRSSGIPYTIVRATQFFEFIGGLADAGTPNGAVHLSDVLMQPIAADDIAGAVAKIALQPPANGYINVAGPEHGPRISSQESSSRHGTIRAR